MAGLKLATSSPVVSSLLKKVHYRLIENLARQGLTIDQMADVLEIEPGTFKKRIAANESLAKAIYNGSREPVKQMEQSLYRRGLGYNYEEFKEKIIYKNGVPIYLPVERTIRHLPGDTRAAELYLVNRAPDRWKKINQIDIQGSLTLRDKVGLVRDQL